MVASQATRKPVAPSTGGVRQYRGKNRGIKRRNPRSCNCPDRRHSRDVWNIPNVKCTHNKKSAQVYSNPNDIPLPALGTPRSKNASFSSWDRVEKPYRLNSGKIEHRKMRCPSMKGSGQSHRQAGQSQHDSEPRAEVPPSSRSPSSWDIPQLVSDIENVMSKDCETNMGPYLDEFIQTMQCLQTKAAISNTPDTLTNADISHFATSCSNLAHSTLDNGRSIPEPSLLALLNHCQYLLSIQLARNNPSVHEYSSPSASRDLDPDQPLGSIENIHDYFPAYPVPPSNPSDSGYDDFDSDESMSMSPSLDEDSPDCSSVFEPVHEEDLSDGEESDVDMGMDEAAVLSRRKPTTKKKKRTLSETVRDPRYKTLKPAVRVVEDVQPVLMVDGEVMREVIDAKEGTLLNPIELDEKETEDESDEEDGGAEIEIPRCRAQSVGFDTFLTHLSADLRWKLGVEIWKES